MRLTRVAGRAKKVNRAASDLLLRVLRDPASLAGLSLEQWDLLIRQARRADMLARIAGLVDTRALGPTLPDPVRETLADVALLAQAQQTEVRREAAFLAAAIVPLGVAVTFLKGAAYLVSGRHAARGRLFSDVDILVPKRRIAEVEAALMLNGWATTHHSAYDQRYYRQWMHEIPPMQHLNRLTVVDVHHAILPETARLRPDAARLLAKAQALDGDPRMQVLAPCDMVLHSMTHLFHNEELSHGLRDLSDLDLLLREFSSLPGFWHDLPRRARELNLTRPLYYGLRHARQILGTPIPEDTSDSVDAFAPPWPLARLMDALWRRALRPPHDSAVLPGTPAALFALYARAHWLRMPPLLLARHLAIKAFKRDDPLAKPTP